MSSILSVAHSVGDDYLQFVCVGCGAFDGSALEEARGQEQGSAQGWRGAQDTDGHCGEADVQTEEEHSDVTDYVARSMSWFSVHFAVCADFVAN
jgi:hypothetical protein